MPQSGASCARCTSRAWQGARYACRCAGRWRRWSGRRRRQGPMAPAHGASWGPRCGEGGRCGVVREVLGGYGPAAARSRHQSASHPRPPLPTRQAPDLALPEGAEWRAVRVDFKRYGREAEYQQPFVGGARLCLACAAAVPGGEAVPPEAPLPGMALLFCRRVCVCAGGREREEGCTGACVHGRGKRSAGVLASGISWAIPKPLHPA